MFNIRLKESYIFIPMLIAYIALGIFYPFLKMDIVKFLLFQILFLLLPGYVFSKWFISQDLSKIQRCIFCYPVSMILIFILSWTGNLLNIKYLESLILLFSTMSIYKIIREDSRETQKCANLPIALSIFLYSICIIIVFRMFILPCSPPSPEYQGLYYQDTLWTVGNTWAYIRGFPLEDPKFSGVLFGYHMLQNIYHATVYKFTGIDPFYTLFSIGRIFYWFITVFLVFYGGLKIARFSLRKVIILCLGLFFTSAFFAGEAQNTLFTNPISWSFGLPVLILFIFYINSYLDKERELDIIYLAILFTYFTATKAILGIIVPIVLIAVFILRKSFFRKRKEILFLFSLFLGAILLKITIFQNAIHELYYDYDTSKSLAYSIFTHMYFIRNYVDIIYPIYRFFSSFFRYLPRYLLNWPVLLFLIVFFTNNKFREKIKDIKGSIMFILVFFLVAISIGCILFFPGARIYNIWYTQIVFLFLGVFALDYILSINDLGYKIISILFLVLSMTVYTLSFALGVETGYGKLPSVKGRIWDPRASISYDEWLAMDWLKKNTGSDQIFFSDRRYFSPPGSEIDLPRFYGYTALSGRQAFAEGEGGNDPNKIPSKRLKSIVLGRWELINRFLSSMDPSEQEDLLKKIRADYFVQSLRFNKKDFSRVADLNLVYENKDIKIFQVFKAKP